MGNIAGCGGKTDLFLYDLKHMDQEAHEKYTGVPNTLILENLIKLSRMHQNIWIRVPVIPGINDGEENVHRMGEFVKSLGIKKLSSTLSRYCRR